LRAPVRGGSARPKLGERVDAGEPSAIRKEEAIPGGGRLDLMPPSERVRAEAEVAPGQDGLLIDGSIGARLLGARQLLHRPNAVAADFPGPRRPVFGDDVGS